MHRVLSSGSGSSTCRNPRRRTAQRRSSSAACLSGAPRSATLGAWTPSARPRRCGAALCGRSFAARDRTHTCAPLGDLDRHFAASEPAVRETFDRIVTVLSGVGPFTVLPEKTRIALHVRMSFAAVMPRKRWLSGTSCSTTASRTRGSRGSRPTRHGTSCMRSGSRRPTKWMKSSRDGWRTPTGWGSSATSQGDARRAGGMPVGTGYGLPRDRRHRRPHPERGHLPARCTSRTALRRFAARGARCAARADAAHGRESGDGRSRRRVA